MIKKLFAWWALCLTAALFLGSCTGQGPLMKRRYTKGYYVSHRSHKQNVKASQTDKEAVASAGHSVPDASPVAPVVEKKAPESIAPVAENTIAAVPAPAKEKAARKTDRSLSIKTEPGAEELQPSRKIDQLLRLRSMVAAKDDTAAREALSLLWVLILVLLIVYVIGLIFDTFGLGWAFHILGVIIVVLLILWLLRIL